MGAAPSNQTTDRSSGNIDILVNNAGVIRVVPLEKTDLALFQKVINTNLDGYLSRHQVPSWR